MGNKLQRRLKELRKIQNMHTAANDSSGFDEPALAQTVGQSAAAVASGPVGHHGTDHAQIRRDLISLAFVLVGLVALLFVAYWSVEKMGWANSILHVAKSAVK